MSKIISMATKLAANIVAIKWKTKRLVKVEESTSSTAKMAKKL